LRRRHLDHVHCSRLDHFGRRGLDRRRGDAVDRRDDVQLEANSGGALEFNTKSPEAPTGKVTIVMTNPSSVPHDIAITGNGVSVIGPIVTSGAKSTVTPDLKPGTYTFYCSVDAHRAAGMQGTLTVK
jgi:plastocyanin